MWLGLTLSMNDWYNDKGEIMCSLVWQIGRAAWEVSSLYSLPSSFIDVVSYILSEQQAMLKTWGREH